ncbi:beta-mannosidase-like [Haliotis rubra]|uniref:beta-mannosidase-like n=1 Tax=Haliotis rubra TaxID=36100 RepID=UPI001EE4EFEE|nr:beta-mannosidase-like [Haliotis rubra]
MAGGFSCALIAALVSVSYADVVQLSGNWTLLNNVRGERMPASVPGSMYTALYNNKLIPDPLYRDNDVKLRWIGREDWTYTRTFQLSSDELAASALRLVCDGLDTFSTVYINDQKVGTSENMFVQYVYDIKNASKVGDNTIRIDFESAVKVAAQKANASAYDIPNDCPNKAQNGECHVNMIRKEQCSFSWDWGPSFPTQGIWKDIYIEAFNTAVIRELSMATRKDSGGEWLLDVDVYFDVSGGPVSGVLTTNIVGTSLMTTLPLKLTPANSSSVFTMRIPSTENIGMWWPNGYGNQTRYNVNVTFTSKNEVSNEQRRVGFRTVELVQDPVGNNQGLTFYFKINDVPVFFKGSNWIPADSFQETITRERLRRLLQSAADVHINSMRVWGGGVYESDVFYDLADEFGIMIWQDLMFSVALYPTTPDFLGTVSQEITHQVRRLRHHASIVLWAGNNENELGLKLDWYGIHANYKRYYDDYVKLYATTLKTIVNKEDTTRVYLSSSPSNGKDTEKEGWVANDPVSELYGDIHFYDNKDLWKDSEYRIPRFASEYGIQAWCDIETLEDVFDAGDFDYWGPMSYHRNHHPFGNIEMIEEIILHFNEPINPDTRQKFSDIIYLTQISQAVSMQAESEHYRRWQNNLTSDGRGQTMGALYWQLNDIWQAPTWASIDYRGKWKMLHYYARRFFAPILISPFMDDNSLNIYMVVDEIPLTEVKDPKTGVSVFAPTTSFITLLKSNFPREEAVNLLTKTAEATAGVLYIQMYRWDNFTPLKTWNVTYKLTKSSESIFNQDIDSMVSGSGCPDRSSCFVYMYLNDPASGINAYLPLTYYNSVTGLAKAQVMVTGVTKMSNTEFEVTVASNRIAPFVWLDAVGISGRFSDNGFLMMAPSRTVTFTSWDSVDLDIVKQSLKTKSLMDIHFS